MNMSVKPYFDMDMHTKPVTKITAVLFMLGALIHRTRLLFGWNVMIAGMMVPFWVSLLVVPVAVLIAFMLMREART
jgi:hypothetical protein